MLTSRRTVRKLDHTSTAALSSGHLPITPRLTARRLQTTTANGNVFERLYKSGTCSSSKLDCQTCLHCLRTRILSNVYMSGVMSSSTSKLSHPSYMAAMPMPGSLTELLKDPFYRRAPETFEQFVARHRQEALLNATAVPGSPHPLERARSSIAPTLLTRSISHSDLKVRDWLLQQPDEVCVIPQNDEDENESDKGRVPAADNDACPGSDTTTILLQEFKFNSSRLRNDLITATLPSCT